MNTCGVDNSSDTGNKIFFQSLRLWAFQVETLHLVSGLYRKTQVSISSYYIS